MAVESIFSSRDGYVGRIKWEGGVTELCQQQYWFIVTKLDIKPELGNKKN